MSISLAVEPDLLPHLQDIFLPVYFFLCENAYGSFRSVNLSVKSYCMSIIDTAYVDTKYVLVIGGLH